MAQPAALPPGVLSLHVLPADHHDKDWDAIIVPSAVKERLLSPGAAHAASTAASSRSSRACRTA